MTACEHQWEWVQPRIVTIGYDLGVRSIKEPDDDRLSRVHNHSKSYNARCTRCGKTTWAHGWNVPMKQAERGH